MHEAPACGREGRRTVALVGDHAPGPWASTVELTQWGEMPFRAGRGDVLARQFHGTWAAEGTCEK